MSWRVVAATAVGTSHIANGLPCQDDCWVQVHRWGDGELLSLFLADGAGSAARGGEGAALAIRAAAGFVERLTGAPLRSLDVTLAQEFIWNVQQAIAEQAQVDGLASRDYACTFLGVLSLGMHTLAFQVGDGAIVLDCGSGLEMLTPPMSGEYANMTYFITQEDAVKFAAIRTFNGPAERLAAFSDGLQRLALNMAAGTPHEPFFEPFFKVLAIAAPHHEDVLQAQLSVFLASAAVNERTDDDKSLVLAVRQDREIA